MASGTKEREPTAGETTRRDEAVRHDPKTHDDEATRRESGGRTRRSYSLRALLPGPYVRYPK
ncbi:hypothetical protein [Haladaptatus salinisoli]|uniref:hypothetical protein n=1 Tax=Haladaptatus salinisoli TaxID=2884876 RepID=UPI001D0A0503|nr:hypothetical protein [Haladaptatus salinisoli]